MTAAPTSAAAPGEDEHPDREPGDDGEQREHSGEDQADDPRRLAVQVAREPQGGHTVNARMSDCKT